MQLSEQTAPYNFQLLYLVAFGQFPIKLQKRGEQKSPRLFYLMGNCSDVTGHRSILIYDAVCPDKCNPLVAFLLYSQIKNYSIKYIELTLDDLKGE